MNIYAATIIVYIIAGIANADKRGLNLRHDDSQAGKLSSWKADETQGCSEGDSDTDAGATNRDSFYITLHAAN